MINLTVYLLCILVDTLASLLIKPNYNKPCQILDHVFISKVNFKGLIRQKAQQGCPFPRLFILTMIEEVALVDCSTRRTAAGFVWSKVIYYSL